MRSKETWHNIRSNDIHMDIPVVRICIKDATQIIATRAYVAEQHQHHNTPIAIILEIEKINSFIFLKITAILF